MSQVHDGVASGPWSGRFGRARAAGALLLALAASPWVAEPARAQSSAAEVQRISDPRILAYGRKVFRRNCAVCHGWNAEGTVADWQTADAEGKYPPPPLNGTAHAWHHRKSVLERTIRQGTARLGGRMPPWEGKLSDPEIEAVIHYLISLWPEELYRAWLKRGGYD